MKSTTAVGVVLIALGILAVVYQGITYTTRKKVVDIGRIQATTKTCKQLTLQPGSEL
jgi:Na+-transporting methylmalonyl-CoA/oxaloacetate decarboxylase gamma subunit